MKERRNTGDTDEDRDRYHGKRSLIESGSAQNAACQHRTTTTAVRVKESNCTTSQCPAILIATPMIKSLLALLAHHNVTTIHHKRHSKAISGLSYDS